MAWNQRRVQKDQKLRRAVLKATRQELANFLIRLRKKLEKRKKLAAGAAFAAGSAAVALGVSAAVVSHGTLIPVILPLAKVVAASGMSTIYYIFKVKELERQLIIVKAGLEAHGIDTALLIMELEE